MGNARYLLPPLITAVFLGPAYFLYSHSPSHSNSVSHSNNPPKFPDWIPLNYSKYQNWVGEIQKEAWIAYPETTQQIVELTNWARHNQFTIRPSGSRHSWAPLTIEADDDLRRVILVDTTKHLKQMEVISNTPGESCFWTQPGVTLLEVAERLEEKGLSLGSFPNVVGPSIGGVLAVGGRGGGSFGSLEETQKGHSFGSVSNMIISLTAVVYDPIQDCYVEKEFHRSDPEAKAFLVHLGRAFITNVTLRAGPLLHFYTKSHFDIPIDTILAPPSVPPPENSFANFMNTANRVGISYFEFSGLAWMKSWKVSPEKPDKAVEIKNSDYYANVFANPGQMNFGPDVTDRWGTSKNVLIIIGPQTPPLALAGWAVITNRQNIQRVVHDFHQIFKTILADHRLGRNHSTNVGLEIRTCELDNPLDVDIPGAESPGLGTLQPIPERPDFNVAVYINVIAANIFTSAPEGQSALEFTAKVEHAVFDHFNSDWSLVRVEWSKSWGLTNVPNVYDEHLISNMREYGAFYSGAWDYSVAVLNKYDPFRIFSSKLLDKLLNSYDSPFVSL